MSPFSAKFARANTPIGFCHCVILTEILPQDLHRIQAAVVALVGTVQVAEVKNANH